MSEEMPSQWEQDVAKTYVHEHPLHRPQTGWLQATVTALLFAVVASFVTGLICVALPKLTLAFPALNSAYEFSSDHRFLMRAIVYANVCLAAVCICSKSILIGAIHLYQHYAPEPVRRRCLFKPTCSEYAILAIRKFGVMPGIMKSLDRLFNRCAGNIYRIDCP